MIDIIGSFDSLSDDIPYKKEDSKLKSKKLKKIKIKSQTDFQMIKNIRKKNLKKNRDLDPNYYIIRDKRKQSNMWDYFFKRESKIGFNTGYMGEAYIYEDLTRLKCFSQISWTAQTDDPENPSIILNNGHRYFIHDKGGRFDINATDFVGIQYYIEIKSTSFDHRDPIICPKQQDFALNLDHQRNYSILANVTNTLSDLPIITYYLFDQNDGFVEIDVEQEHTDQCFIKSLYERGNIGKSETM